MSRTLAAMLALMLPALASAQASTPAAPTLTGHETRVTTDLADQYDPAISGNLVVYTDARGSDRDIWYYDLSTGLEKPVTTALGNQDLTDVSDGLIAYTDESVSDVVVFDPAAGTNTDLTAGSNSLSIDPAIGQKLVAWTDSRDGNLEIYAKDLVTGEERRISNSPDRDERAAVHSGTIVWQHCAMGYCDVWAYDWKTATTRQLTNTPTDDERLADVWKTSVVYQGLRNGDKDIFFFDLASGREKQLALAGDQVNPNISGDFVAFEDLSTGVYKIRLWHVPSGAVFDVSNAASGAQFLNDIDGNRIVYTDDRNGQLDIYLYEFQASFPYSLPTDCAHLDGARPVLDNIFERTPGSPDEFSVDFAAQAGPGLVCITNGPGTAGRVSSAEVELNSVELARENDFNADVASLQRGAELQASNTLKLELSSAPGSALRIQVFQAAAGGELDTDTRGLHRIKDGSSAKHLSNHDLGSAKQGLSGEPLPAVGCSQSGAGLLAPVALALLALLAMLPKPSPLRVRSRRR